jgi:4-carboxymuconolactone decarboxylase
MTPRIPPVPAGTDDAEVAEAMAGAIAGADGEPLNIFLTMARHPKLMKRWLPFGGHLLARGLLPARHRELAILRTAWNCRAEYEWGHHVPISHQAGLTDNDVERVAAGPDAEGWSALEAAVLRAADELHAVARVGDATWADLAAGYDQAQLVELVMLVGQYHLVSFFLNSAGVELEPGYPGLPHDRSRSQG